MVMPFRFLNMAVSSTDLRSPFGSKLVDVAEYHLPVKTKYTTEEEKQNYAHTLS